MTPTEKNIRSRFKESFSYKFDEKYWEDVLAKVQEEEFELVIVRYRLPNVKVTKI